MPIIRLTESDTLRVNQSIRDLWLGRSNAVGTVTLNVSATTTAVTAVNCGADSKIFLMPTTANAAADIGAGTLYVSVVDRGTFTITHASNAFTDRTFYWLAMG